MSQLFLVHFFFRLVARYTTSAHIRFDPSDLSGKVHQAYCEYNIFYWDVADWGGGVLLRLCVATGNNNIREIKIFCPTIKLYDDTGLITF